jgi:hypothetical protein
MPIFILLFAVALSWGNSSHTINVCYVQKRMIRIITGIGNRTSCKQSFSALKMLTLSFLYIYSLLCFVVDNVDQYYFVSDIHDRNIRQVLNLKLYQLPTHLSLYKKGSYYIGFKLFNYLPSNLKKLYKDAKQFKLKLKEFLSRHSFYTNLKKCLLH